MTFDGEGPTMGVKTKVRLCGQTVDKNTGIMGAAIAAVLLIIVIASSGGDDAPTAIPGPVVPLPAAAAGGDPVGPVGPVTDPVIPVTPPPYTRPVNPPPYTSPVTSPPYTSPVTSSPYTPGPPPPRPVVPTMNLVETLVSMPDTFSTLVAAVTAAGLVPTLSGAGPFTVFAPTDAAFSALGQSTMNSLLADPTGQLATILTYHVAAGHVLSTQLRNGMQISTVEGEPITVTIDGDGVHLNGVATVRQADVECSNGVAHVIDAVLIPPASTGSPPPPGPPAGTQMGACSPITANAKLSDQQVRAPARTCPCPHFLARTASRSRWAPLCRSTPSERTKSSSSSRLARTASRAGCTTCARHSHTSTRPLGWGSSRTRSGAITAGTPTSGPTAATAASTPSAFTGTRAGGRPTSSARRTPPQASCSCPTSLLQLPHKHPAAAANCKLCRLLTVPPRCHTVGSSPTTAATLVATLRGGR